MCVKDQILQKYNMLVMFAHLLCALLSCSARKFLAKFKTQEPGEIIAERILYT